MKRNEFANYVLYDANGSKQDFMIMEINQALQFDSSYIRNTDQQDFFQVIYITEGEGVHYVDLQAFEFKKGDICFVNTRQRHNWSISKDIKGYVITFKSAFLTKFMANHLFVQELSFFKRFTTHNLADNNFLVHKIELAIHSILDEIRLEINKDINLVRIYLLEILLICKRKIDRKIQTEGEGLNSNTIINQFEYLIENHFQEYKFPKEYAKHLLVTPNYLNSICRKIKGKSAGDLIRDRILLESKKLLISTNLSASEIAYRLNFKDSSYFTRFFKKYVDMTPDEYRRNNN